MVKSRGGGGEVQGRGGGGGARQVVKSREGGQTPPYTCTHSMYQFCVYILCVCVYFLLVWMSNFCGLHIRGRDKSV